jgi:hypothetical protein
MKWRGLRHGLATLKLRFFTPTYEAKVMAGVKKNVRAGATCADVGANIGLVTHVLAKATGKTGRTPTGCA